MLKRQTLNHAGLLLLLLLLWTRTSLETCHAFVVIGGGGTSSGQQHGQRIYAPPSLLLQRTKTTTTTTFRLRMAMDPVTYLRTEWVSAALCTNQTPRAADVCLQLGTQDGRAVTFIPRTIRQLITSSAEKDGKLTIQARRQLKQTEEQRGAAKVVYVDQRADDLKETASESVDVVISLQATERMVENGLDWKQSVREAARVLKPGGRLLWVEPDQIQGESFIQFIETLTATAQTPSTDVADNDAVPSPIFDDVGYDDIDMVLQPHTAGVAVKSMDGGMTPAQREQKIKKEEQDKLADLTIQAYERGSKKGKRKRKKPANAGSDGAAAAGKNKEKLPNSQVK